MASSYKEAGGVSGEWWRDTEEATRLWEFGNLENV